MDSKTVFSDKREGCSSVYNYSSAGRSLEEFFNADNSIVVPTFLAYLPPELFDLLDKKEFNRQSVQHLLNIITLYRTKGALPYGIAVITYDKKTKKSIITNYDVNTMIGYVFTDSEGNPRYVMPPINETIWNIYEDDVESIHKSFKFKVNTANVVKWLNLICDGDKIFPERCEEQFLHYGAILKQDWATINNRYGIHPFVNNLEQNKAMIEFLESDDPRIRAYVELHRKKPSYFNNDDDDDGSVPKIGS